MRRSKPYLQQDEREILDEDPMADQAQAYNEVAESLGESSLPTDPYERVQAEALNAVQHGGYIHPQNRIGRGYVHPQNAVGGYINPSGGFAFLPILGSLAATFLPDAIRWVVNKVKGKGMSNITGGMLHTTVPLNMSNAHSFYTSLADDLSRQAPKEYIHKKFEKLFGSGWKKYYNRKDGGAVVDELKMGHLLAPVIMGHLKKIKGIDPELVMEALEKHPIMEKKVDKEVLTSGGSILGTIWNVVKNLFTSDTAKNLVKTIAPKAIEGVANYGLSKLKGKEPEPKYKPAPRYRPAPATGYRSVEEAIPIPEETYMDKVAKRTVGRIPEMMLEGMREKSRSEGLTRRKPQPYVESSGISSKKKKIVGGWVVKLQRE